MRLLKPIWPGFSRKGAALKRYSALDENKKRTIGRFARIVPFTPNFNTPLTQHSLFWKPRFTEHFRVGRTFVQ